MCPRNRKVTNERWGTLRRIGRWVGGKVRTGALALGIQGALLLGLAIASLWGIALARRHVGAQEGFRVHTARLRAEAPAWCADDLARVEFPRDSYSVFDSRLTRDVAAAYERSPWVAAVRRVEKRLPNELVVELDLRRPVAFVRLPGGYHAIDEKAILLPLNYSRWDHAGEPLVHVFGVRGKPPSPGSRWADGRVAAALAVLDALADDPFILARMHEIDVGNLGGAIDPNHSEIVLLTRGRARVAWGRPPGGPSDSTEIPVAEKLATLRRRLEGPLSPSTTIELRFRPRRTIARSNDE